MGVEPVPCGGVRGCEGHMAVVSTFHFGNHNSRYLLQFVGADVEVEFVVNLQNHLGFEAGLAEAGVNAVHGNLDDVGRCALNGRVDGVSFAETAHHGVARVDVG